MNALDTARGTKRVCQNCSARYYDLGRDAPVCPKCGAAYVAPPPALPAQRLRRPRVTAPVPAPVVEADAPVMDGRSADVANVVDDDEDEEKSERDEADAEDEESGKTE